MSALALACASTLASAQSHKIEHMDPPFWWAGMQNTQLQLMVHGKDIGASEPELSYPGVRIERVIRVPGKNYLFVDLTIGRDAVPGQLEIKFRRDGKSISAPYQLMAREPGSAQRRGFGREDAIYQFMPDRFVNGDPANDSVAGMREKANRGLTSGRHGGDIKGIADRLDYIGAMGFTQIWPTPLMENDQKDWSYHGYALTNHYRIDARYGSNEDYRKMVAKAREKGIGVIQDVVLNHIGVHHWWMKDLPTPDWTNFDNQYVPTKHHRVANQDPYGSKYDKRNFTAGWFNADMPDLNQANPLVANYLVQNAIWWIEYAGLSGMRVDTYGYSDRAFLTEWGQRIMREYPNLNLVGEEFSTIPAVVAHWQRGKHHADGYRSSIPSMVDFPMNEALIRSLAAKDDDYDFNLTTLYERLSLDYLYPDPSNLVLFDGNHDVPRIFSRLNHDFDLFRMAIAYLATAPRIAQFYYGTEILMPSDTKPHVEASYRLDFPGGWAGDKVNAFTGEGLTAQQREAQAYMKKLLNWRKQQPVIHSGKMMQFGPEDNTYVYFRYNDSKRVMVVMNKNAKEVELKTARFAEMLSGVDAGTDVVTGKTYRVGQQIVLPARSVLVLELDAKS